MPIPEEVINEIKYKNPIESVISQYVNLKHRGKNMVGLCPFHNEKTPSFTVYPQNGSFYCFGCGAGGDVFSFVRLMDKVDYIDAVRLLAERSGISIVSDGFSDSMQNLRSKIYEINQETALYYYKYLISPQGKWALDYYLSRGLKMSTIKHFGLGAAPDSWDSLLKHLRAKGFSDNDMLQANVIVKGKNGGYYDRFRNRTVFPIINIRGKVIGFSGRARPENEKQGGKYVNTADTPVYKKSENLFGMNFAKNYCSEQIILVEGNMDVISVHQAGLQNTVAALGTAFTPQQAKLMSRYTKEVVLTMDADEAGQKAVKKAAEILKSTGLEIKVAVVPDGKDPDEYIKKNGADKFKKVIENAVPLIEYDLLAAAGNIDATDDNGKIKYLNAAAEIIANTTDIVERDLYISRLCEKFSVSRTALETKVNELRRRNVRYEKKKEINNIIHPKYSFDDINPQRRLSPYGTNAEETVIAAVLQHPDLCGHALNEIEPEEFITALNRRIFERIKERYEEGNPTDVSSFGDILSPAESGYVAMLFNSDKCEKNPLTVLNDSIRVLKDEKARLSSANVKDMTVDDWASNLKKIIEEKKKGN